MMVRRWGIGTFSVILILTLACSRDAGNAQAGAVYRETRDMIATLVTLTVVASDEDAARKAMDAGFGEIERLARLLSWWDPGSELSRVNREAAEGPVPVSPEVLELSRTALSIAERSGGAFDPTAGPLVRLWNVTKATSPPTDDDIARARDSVGYRKVRIEDGGIRFLEGGVEFNLGGIAKGYMADRVVATLRENGIASGLVAVAGDIRGFGLRPDGTPWRVGIQDPRGEGLLAELELRDAAVSTSGDYERFFVYEGMRYHHILDPATGFPARGTQSLTVVHEQAVMADGLATALFVLGPGRAAAFMAEEGLAGLIVDDEHESMVTPAGQGLFDLKPGRL